MGREGWEVVTWTYFPNQMVEGKKNTFYSGVLEIQCGNVLLNRKGEGGREGREEGGKEGERGED